MIAESRRSELARSRPARLPQPIEFGRRIFEDSPIGFNKWLPVMWLIASCRIGVSSYEVARRIGVTQKTAWFMLHRLRLAMRADGGEMLAGQVEADETFVAGEARSSRR